MRGEKKHALVMILTIETEESHNNEINELIMKVKTELLSEKSIMIVIIMI